MRMRKEQLCSLLAVVMTAAFFVTLLWGYGQYQQNKRALILLENEYQRAYYNYLAEMRDMILAAGKAHSSTASQQAALQQAASLGRLQILAESAANHMARLPIQQAQYQRSVHYLNQVGDYAAGLAQTLGRGESLDEQQRHSLGDIYTRLQNLQSQMADMEEQVAAGTIAFAKAEGNWWQSARTALAGSRPVQGTAAAVEQKTADGYFSRMDALLEGWEPLSYGGKYSAHLSSLPAMGLTGLRQINAAEAQGEAAEFLRLTGQANAELAAQEEIGVNETLPLFGLRFTTEAEENIYITLSQAGGKIISYSHERPLGEARLSAETGLQNAENLLRKAGYGDLQLVSRQRLGEALLLQYVPLQQEILYYPDSLFVKVALDDGAIVGLNTQPYWRNNHLRILPAEDYNTEEALAALGELALIEQAQVSGTALAYISDGVGGEKLCYEIRHSVDGEEFLTYIGTDSLLEEQILRRYAAEDGSFYTR